MPRYKVIVSRHVAQQLLAYTRFISNVSPGAARAFVVEYEEILERIEDNPLQFQMDTSFENPVGYRRAVFAQWYKCVFKLDGYVVYVDAVVDCRKDQEGIDDLQCF